MKMKMISWNESENECENEYESKHENENKWKWVKMSENENESEYENENQNQNENQNEMKILSYPMIPHMAWGFFIWIQLIIMILTIIRSPTPPLPLSSSSLFVLTARKTTMATMTSGGSGTTAFPLGGFES